MGVQAPPRKPPMIRYSRVSPSSCRTLPVRTAPRAGRRRATFGQRKTNRKHIAVGMVGQCNPHGSTHHRSSGRTQRQGDGRRRHRRAATWGSMTRLCGSTTVGADRSNGSDRLYCLRGLWLWRFS